MITMSVFNISSDLMMLCIPLPLLINARFPLKRYFCLTCKLCYATNKRRKLVICGVFSLGIFVVRTSPKTPSFSSTNSLSQILAAVLNRYFNLTAAYSPIFLNWYVGEVSTAVFVANIPLCWPLIRYVFSLDEWASKRSRRTGNSESNLSYFSRRFYSRGGNSTHGRAAERLHSEQGSTVGINGLEEQTTTSWEDQSRGELRLDPLSKVTRYKTNITGGNGEEDSKDSRGDEGTIVKTFQVSQYST
jgi:hypothetical protein